MNLWMLLGAVEAIMLALMATSLVREKNNTKKIKKDLKNLVNRSEMEVQNQKYIVGKLQISLKNAENAQKFMNKIQQKPTYCHRRYIKVYHKELVYMEAMQKVYLVFYEDDYIYTRVYLRDKHVDFDINRDVTRFELKCMMFIDGEELAPALHRSITPDCDTIKVEELNMNMHEGKGGGSFYLECLSKESLRYPQIFFLYGFVFCRY